MAPQPLMDVRTVAYVLVLFLLLTFLVRDARAAPPSSAAVAAIR
jgi:hypothetical protein